MKIQAFKWDIEVTEYYVKVNGETVATGYIPIGRSNEQIISSDKDADVFFDSVFNPPEPNQALKDAEQALERIENKKISNSGHYTKEELIFFADYFAKIYHKEQLGLSQPTDCDGTPLEYGDKIVCVEPFTCEDGLDWFIGEEEIHRSQRIIDSEKIHKTEFTPSELKNFRKVN